MTQRKSRYEFQQDAAMSQKLAHKHPEYQYYAGTEHQISQSIAVLNWCAKMGYMDPESQGFKMIHSLLNEQRKAAFATSERVNEITKMGLQMPRSDSEVDLDDDGREETE